MDNEITYIAKIRRKGNWSGKEDKGFHDAVYIKAGGNNYIAHYSLKSQTNRDGPVYYEIDGPITGNNSTWTILDDKECNSGVKLKEIMMIQENSSYSLFNQCMSFANKAFDTAK